MASGHGQEGNVPASNESETESRESESRNDSQNESSASMSGKKPTGVSEAAWEKFQRLKEKRLALVQKPSQKKSKSKGLKIPSSSEEKEGAPGTSIKSEEIDLQNKSVEKEKWDEVKNYLGTFDNLEAPCVDQHYKSGLEKRLEAAIAEGDINEAEKLSDQLSNREFGAKIANAFDAQRFTKRRKEKEEDLKEKKKRKLNWQFEHKEKWEMKANM